jgi:hypothetical protein
VSDFGASRSTGKSGRRALVDPPVGFGVDDCRAMVPLRFVDADTGEFAFFFTDGAIEAVVVPMASAFAR